MNEELIAGEVLSFEPREEFVRLGNVVIRASLIAYVELEEPKYNGPSYVVIHLLEKLRPISLYGTDADEARKYFSEKVQTAHDD